MEPVFIFFLILWVAKLVGELTLDRLNLRHALAHRDTIPAGFESFTDPETHRRSIDYTEARLRFGGVEALFSAALLLLLLASGWLAGIYEWLSGLLGGGVWGQSFALLGTIIFLSLPGLPFDWWSTFHLEERFGFNKSTPGLWISDKVKGLILSILIGWPLVALLIAFVGWFPSTWWVWGFALFFGFQILMAVVYPMWILPLFNKLTPLEEGPLKDALFALARRTGFAAKTILVIDGSKRSGHSNAFFAGFGRFRRIVLYDTLMEQLTQAELEAVLAHEIGHYKLGHIPKMLGLSAFIAFAVFALIGWLHGQPAFLSAFGFSEGVAATGPTLLLVMLLSGFVGFWLGPLTNRLSRKFEYEADAFASDAVDGSAPLVGALQKLHTKNLSNPVPHPLYSNFHYSHPAMIERLDALKGLKPAPV